MLSQERDQNPTILRVQELELKDSEMRIPADYNRKEVRFEGAAVNFDKKVDHRRLEIGVVNAIESDPLGRECWGGWYEPRTWLTN